MRTFVLSLFALMLLVLPFGAAAADSPAAERWICPMPEHPTIHDRPGLCPQCQMDLVAKSELDRQHARTAIAVSGRAPGADLQAPASGRIRVAFAISENATMIDFTGPWEVFQDVDLPGRGTTTLEQFPFELYTVAETREPIHASGGMTIVPDYTFADAPAPRVVIVPAQSGSPALHAWLRAQRPHVDVLASVCTGAFHLARAGLLDGKAATTHHDFFAAFEKSFPKVRLVRGRRFVESDRVVATSGGLSSGIDLALHIVQRYFGRDVAAATAEYMEYDSRRWETGAAGAD
jgi:transcriptional regulator GlxA family with amidase domain